MDGLLLWDQSSEQLRRAAARLIHHNEPDELSLQKNLVARTRLTEVLPQSTIVPGFSGDHAVHPPIDAEKIYAITRPNPVLLTLYLFRSLASLIFFPLVFAPLLCRYITLRYRFDGESVRKSYGLLFHHEDLVQYARIQDLHLRRGLLERWLGLGTVQVETAAGSAAPEVTIEGLTNFEEIRDFLYTRMRGARFGEEETKAQPGGAPTDGILTLLTEIRDEVRLLRGS